MAASEPASLLTTANPLPGHRLPRKLAFKGYWAILAGFWSELLAARVVVWTIIFTALWVYCIYLLFAVVRPSLFTPFWAWVALHGPYGNTGVMSACW